MTDARCVVAIDVGGTTLKGGLCNADGALVHRDRRPTPDTDTATLAAAHDPAARPVWDRAVAALGAGLAAAVALLDPALVVVGGGLADAGEQLLDPLAADLAARVVLGPRHRSCAPSSARTPAAAAPPCSPGTRWRTAPPRPDDHPPAAGAPGAA